MNFQGYKCSLHKESFEFFCERCLQPVCRQCTVIGPHHTQIHSLAKIGVAYQRRVEQIKMRIDQMVGLNRENVFKLIAQINADVQRTQLIRRSIDAQNNKQKEKIIMKLIKQFQNNINLLHSYRQNLLVKSNQINDIGYQYENVMNDIQILGSHQKILSELKELHDRIQILLQKQIPLQPFTRQLTNMRISLRQVQCLKQFYQEKIKILTLIIQKINKLTVPAHRIDYQIRLKDLNNTLQSINHYVCNFCGVSLSNQSLNTQCKQNSINLNSLLSTSSQGNCKNPVDANKVGTHRHFFGEPKDCSPFYNTETPDTFGSFQIQLNAILLKAKTLCKIKNINIMKQFSNNDKKQTNYCQKIVFDYILIEIVGLNTKQKDVLMTISKKSYQNTSFFTYSQIVQRIEKIDI